MTNAVNHRERPAACPRCGYDQRGLIASWGDACPLVGTCAECGLAFSWSEVLRPDAHEPRWCVEYAARRRYWLPPARGTLLRMIWPWWFWRSLKMSHEIRPGRIAAFVAMLVVALATAYVVEQAVVAVQVDRQFRRQVTAQATAIRPMYQQQIAQLEQMRDQHRGRRSPVDEQYETYIAQLRAIANAPPPNVVADLPDVVADAVLTPWAGRASGTVVSVYSTMAYPPPRHLHQVLFGLSMKPPGRWRRGAHPFELVAIGSGAGLVLLAMLPASFVLLPISRRRATVRWRHLGRISAYSVTLPIILLGATLVTLTVAAASIRVRGEALAVAIGLLIWVPVPLAIVWWAAAIRSHLRIPHAWSVTLVLSALSLLLVLAITWLSWPDVALRVYELLAEPWLG